MSCIKAAKRKNKKSRFTFVKRLFILLALPATQMAYGCALLVSNNANGISDGSIA
jgi:hypothetical protein